MWAPAFHPSLSLDHLPHSLESSPCHDYNTHNDNSTIFYFLQLSSTFSDSLPLPWRVRRQKTHSSWQECERRYYLLANAPLATPLAEFARVFKAEHRIEESLQ